MTIPYVDDQDCRGDLRRGQEQRDSESIRFSFSDGDRLARPLRDQLGAVEREVQELGEELFGDAYLQSDRFLSYRTRVERCEATRTRYANRVDSLLRALFDPASQRDDAGLFQRGLFKTAEYYNARLALAKSFYNELQRCSHALQERRAVEGGDGTGHRPTAAAVGFEKAQVHVLLRWVEEHNKYPYPTKEEMLGLSASTGLSTKQINTWFTNYRARVWKPKVFYNQKRKSSKRAGEQEGGVKVSTHEGRQTDEFCKAGDAESTRASRERYERRLMPVEVSDSTLSDGLIFKESEKCVI